MWKYKTFEELTTAELYEILKLRVDTFVVEQQCAYPEIDDKDQQSIHIFYVEKEITAYARLIIDEEVHIGRVIVAKHARGTGLARELMVQCMDYIKSHYPELQMHLQGQAHLEPFYSSYGFKTDSVVYFEDMIPHIDMIQSSFNEQGA